MKKLFLIGILLPGMAIAQNYYHYYNNVPWGFGSSYGPDGFTTYHYYNTPWGGFGSSYGQNGFTTYHWYNSPSVIEDNND